jgi:hypothetical protein
MLGLIASWQVLKLNFWVIRFHALERGDFKNYPRLVSIAVAST